MPITRDDVLHVAKLARLELSESEVLRMVTDLGGILEHVVDLASVDTEGVPATSYAEVTAAPLRADVIAPGVDREAALREAPRRGEGGFRVPGFVDEG